MEIAPLQAFGIGDIIFCMTLAQEWIEQGHNVTWGVEPQFIEGLQRAYPNVTFKDWRQMGIDYNNMSERDENGYRVIPLRWSVELCKVPYSDCMKSKYQMFGRPFTDWRLNALWLRDGLKELQLSKLLGIKPGMPFVFINSMFQSDFAGNANIKVKTLYPTVYMHNIEGVSLFDWVYIASLATEIHTVSTSLLYCLELMDLKQPIHLYARPTDPNFDQVKYLFTKPYILHHG